MWQWRSLSAEAAGVATEVEENLALQPIPSSRAHSRTPGQHTRAATHATLAGCGGRVGAEPGDLAAAVPLGARSAAAASRHHHHRGFDRRDFVRAENFENTDFGLGPRVTDQLYQGPFPQYRPQVFAPDSTPLMATWANNEPNRGFGKGLITYIVADEG
jgi:hypothetical protein